MGLEKISEEEVKKSEEVKCDICGKTFKDKSGLAGHKRLSHSEETRKTIPDEIGKRLEAIEKQVATTIDPKKEIESRETIENILNILLPAAKKYDMALGPFGKNIGKWMLKREWVVKRASECPQNY